MKRSALPLVCGRKARVFLTSLPRALAYIGPALLEACVVVDRDVQELPAGCAFGPPRAVAGDALAGQLDAAELLMSICTSSSGCSHS